MRASSYKTLTGFEAVKQTAGVLGGTVYELPKDYPQLLELLHAADNRPAGAFHVAVDSASDLAPFAAQDIPLIASGSAQEASDMAALASVMARQSGRPVLHFFDRRWVGEEFCKIDAWTKEALDLFVSESSKIVSSEDLFEGLCKRLKDITGRSYAAFEYSGDSAPESIPVVCATEHRPPNSVVVRLWRPFGARRFLETVPSTVQSFSVGKILHADVLSAVHEGIVGGWTWFVHLPPIHPLESDLGGKIPEAAFRAVIQTTGPADDIESAVREMIADLANHSTSYFQAYTLKTPEGSAIHLRIDSKPIGVRGPVTEPVLTLSLRGPLLNVSGPSGEMREIDAAGIARRAGLGERIGPVVVSALLYHLDCEKNLGLAESRARDLLHEAVQERWSDFSEDIVAAHRRALETTRREILHPGSATAPHLVNATASPAPKSGASLKADLQTEYLGFRLNSPLIACLRMEAADEGGLGTSPIGAVFFGPVSEEELDREAWKTFQAIHQGIRQPGAKARPPLERYVERLQAVKNSVEVPVIAGLEASSEKNWLSLAFALEQGGADALEIFLKSPEEGGPADPMRIASLTAAALKIPVAIRITPSLVRLTGNAEGLGGAKGLVLYSPPLGTVVDPENLETSNEKLLSESQAFRLALPELIKLSADGPRDYDLAAAGPIEATEDLLKALLAGAKAVYVVPEKDTLSRLERDLRAWMTTKGFTNLQNFTIGHGKEKRSAVD